MRKLLFAPFFLILGCSGGPTIVQGPDGTPHNLITCLNLADCYEEAARECGGKYNIVHTANQDEFVGFRFHGQTSRVSILVKCEKQPPAGAK